MRALVVAGVVAGLTGSAAADYHTHDLKRIEEGLKQTPPARGVDKAPVAAPAWCGPLKEKPYTAGFDGHLGSYYGAPESKFYALVGAAQALCKNDPNAPIIQRATAEVVQLWMNKFGLSAPDAIESIALTVDKDRNEAAAQKLCAALAIDDEVGGAERAFMQARRELFECTGGEKISLVGSTSPMERLVPWLDSSAKEPDELVRLAFVAAEVSAFQNASDSYRDRVLLASAISQFDAKALDPKKALAMLDAAPYKGNIYARVAVKETLGRTRLGLLALEDAIKAKAAKDPDWKELLLAAPQRGYDAWVQGAAKFKAELQRSADFEQTAFGPSRKAMAGCQQTLEKDLVAVLKPLKKETPKELVDQMNAHPVAGLLFRRYQACVAGDGDGMAANEMRGVAGLRVVRGPRAAAYYATLDALGKIRADRAKFALQESDLPFDRKDILEQLTADLAKGDATGYHVWEEAGVVKSVKKDKDGVAVVFAKDKQQVWSQTCKQLNRIIMFANDGRPIYDQSCTGKVITADVSPNPIFVPAHLADGLAAGRRVSFGVSNSGAKRVSMPFAVYADKQGKKLVAWYGIEL